MSSRCVSVVWVVAFGGASSAWCLTSARQLGATFDEPFYLRAGLESWRTGSNKPLLRAGTMPLPVEVETFPLYVWERMGRAPFDVDRDIATMLAVARAGNLVFWWLLLVYGFAWGRLLGGAWGGRLAVALLACEPNLLAHASLATTDISVSACLLAFGYQFHVGRGGDWCARVGLPALWYGVGLTAKASMLVWGPLVALALEAARLSGEGRLAASGMGIQGRIGLWWCAFKPCRLDLYKMGGLGLLWAFVYCGCDWKPEPTFVKWAVALPAGTFHDAMLWVAENLRIFSNAGEGLAYQIKHNIRGHGTFVLDEWYPRAVWFYFPVALSVKLSAVVLALLAAVACINRRALYGPLGVATLALFLFTFNCRVQIGIRLVLPLVAFLMVTLGLALVRIGTSVSPGVRRMAAVAALGAVAVPPALVWPDGLATPTPCGAGRKRPTTTSAIPTTIGVRGWSNSTAGRPSTPAGRRACGITAWTRAAPATAGSCRCTASP